MSLKALLIPALDCNLVSSGVTGKFGSPAVYKKLLINKRVWHESTTAK
jgi:hypothetical protein